MRDMQITQKFFDDNFFIIAPENINTITTRLYGYAITDDKILINSRTINTNLPPLTSGTFVHVIKNKDYIHIYQDYCGSFGLFIYNDNDFFAISNSFLYLVNYLKNKKNLTFNMPYARALLQIGSSLAYEETPIREILCLPRNTHIQINIKTKRVNIIKEKITENCIRIDSEEGINLIDNWARKWNNIYRSIINKNFPIEFRISGGFDSRAALGTVMAGDIDLSKIFFFAAEDDLYTHKEDFEIASLIAAQCGFSLNQAQKSKGYRMDPLDCLDIVLFSKCGFHRELLSCHFFSPTPYFIISGAGGGSVRAHWSISFNNFIKQQNWGSFNTLDTQKDTQEMIQNSYIKVKKALKNAGMPDEQIQLCTLGYIFYSHIRYRYHVGRANVELFLGNQIMLDPTGDPVLLKLNHNISSTHDRNLLFAILYDRFLPQIEDIKMDSGKHIDKKTSQIAHQINSKKVFIKDTLYKNITFDISERSAPQKATEKTNMYEYMYNMFSSDELKMTIIKLFGEETYTWASRYYTTASYHSFMPASLLLQLFIIYKASLQSSNRLASNIAYPAILSQNKNHERYKNNGFINEIFDFLRSCRIDIKNFGQEKNDFYIISSNSNLFIETPLWYKTNQGQGHVLQISATNLEFQIQAKGKGIIQFDFKAPYMLNSSKQPIKIKTDYMYIEILNKYNEQLFISDKTITTTTKNPYTLRFKCNDNDKFFIKIKWLPFQYSQKELLQIIEELYANKIGTFLWWKPSQTV